MQVRYYYTTVWCIRGYFLHYCQKTQTRSLYIHWPFCPYKCHFCPFVALASHDQFMERYHRALVSEIRLFAEQQHHKDQIDTIHFGGGTPSTYPNDLLLDMFGILRESFEIQPTVEIALEVNPGTVHAGQLEVWKACGVNRLSIGVQSLKDKVLSGLNRHQTARQVYELLEKASMFFDNLSVDLILGLPDVSADEWRQLIQEVVSWPIKHVSVYFLSVHENTPLYFKVKTNQITLPSDEHVVALYQWTCNMLMQHDFLQYELSNFAKKSYESRHNCAYWDRREYRGFGIGACSFDGTRRMQNEKNIMRYMDAIEKNEPVIVFHEELTDEQVKLERLMLGLRRPVGVTLQDFVDTSSQAQKDALHKTVQKLHDCKLIEWNNDSIRLTMQGLALENEVIAQLSGRH